MMSSPTRSSSRVAHTNNEQGMAATLGANGASERPSEGASNVGIDATLSEPFAPFARQEELETPFENEMRRDTEFQEQLHKQLLDLVLDFHAWSTSRPDFESQTTGEALFEETRVIENLEQEQGMWTTSFFFEQSRLRLVEFITRIKAALEVLTSTGFGL